MTADKVYVLTEEPYHENSTVIGVYRTVEAMRDALAHRPGVKEINSEPVEDQRTGRWILARGSNTWGSVDFEVTPMFLENG